MEFSKKLKKLRMEKGLSQQNLADMIYVSRSAVAKWENGLGFPSEESYNALAEVFGVSKDFFKMDNPEQIIVEKNKRIKIISNIMRVAVFIIVCGAVFFSSQHTKDTKAALYELDTRIEVEFAFAKSGVANYLLEQDYSAHLSEAITKFRMAALYGYYLDGQAGGDPQWLILAEQLREVNNPDIYKYLSDNDREAIASFLEQHEYQNDPEITEADIAPLIERLQKAVNEYMN